MSSILRPFFDTTHLQRLEDVLKVDIVLKSILSIEDESLRQPYARNRDYHIFKAEPVPFLQPKTTADGIQVCAFDTNDWGDHFFQYPVDELILTHIAECWKKHESFLERILMDNKYKLAVFHFDYHENHAPDFFHLLDLMHEFTALTDLSLNMSLPDDANEMNTNNEMRVARRWTSLANFFKSFAGSRLIVLSLYQYNKKPKKQQNINTDDSSSASTDVANAIEHKC
jgi:hypothetical protein